MTKFDLIGPSEDTLRGSLEDAMQEFLLQLRASGASEKTVRSYRAAIKDFISIVGNKKVSELSERDIQRWRLERIKRGFNKSIRGKGSETTLYYYSLFIRSFIRWLGLKINVGGFKKGSRRLIETLKPQEIFKLLNAARDATDLLIISLLVETGLRASELLSLRWRDIDLEAREIYVRGAKYGEERVVFIGDLSKRVLEAVKPSISSEDERVIPITYTALYKRLKTLAMRAGIDPKRVRPHILRHTFATESLKRGLPLPVLQRILGHKDIKTTQIYLHMVKEDIKNIYLKIYSISGVYSGSEIAEGRTI
ncbi:MAG: tyrosine-type recombinase/integrase [Sulfolobales archaeon]